MTDALTTEAPRELFNPPIPSRAAGKVQHVSEVFGINGLDLDALDEDLTFPEFAAIGEWVQGMSAASPWWEGDWANWGEMHFGDEYYSAISIDWSDATEHARRRVTAGSFTIDQRRAELSFAHHQIVVSKIRKGVDIDMERQAWLDLAIRDGLTAPQLAKAVRDAQAIEVDEVAEPGPGEAPRDPVAFTTFTISFTVAVADAEDAEPIMERGETALKAELERARVHIKSNSSRRSG